MSIFKPTFPRLQPGDPLARGLVAAWQFYEGAGLVLNDVSGNGNNGAFVGSPTWAPGRAGQSLYFNGSSGVSVPSFAINTLTISLWMQTTQTFTSTGAAQLINRDTTGGNNSRDWQFRIGTSPTVPQIILFNTVGTIAGITGTTVVNDGKWHIVTTTWDGTTMYLYVDGKQSGPSVAFAGTLNAGSPLLFAEASGITGGSNYVGSMDDARIYNRALSAAEVMNLYVQSGAP